MSDHKSRLALIKAHLECARQGYAVHVSCLGECTWREDTEDYDCHRCEKRVPFGSVCDPPGNDYYESDVAFLLDLIEAERRANAHAIAELCGQVNELRAQADCGQDGVCAVSPGCNRHWEARNRELVTERDQQTLRANRSEADVAVLNAKLGALQIELRHAKGGK